VEFAAERFGTRLVVVMGHTGCSAILSTLEQLENPGNTSSRNLRSIVERVQPSVEPLLKAAGKEAALDRPALLREATRANVRAAAEQLRHGSELLEQHIRHSGLRVVGAEYNLESGEVEFFDGA
jgi:carbonic anhydrase